LCVAVLVRYSTSQVARDVFRIFQWGLREMIGLI